MSPRVLAVVAGVGAAVFFFAPGALKAAGPLLIALACPVSMVVMMTMMARSQRQDPGNTPIDQQPHEPIELTASDRSDT